MTGSVFIQNSKSLFLMMMKLFVPPISLHIYYLDNENFGLWFYIPVNPNGHFKTPQWSFRDSQLT